MIRVIGEMNMTIYENDINRAQRLGLFKGQDHWPRLIQVEMVSERIRNRIMEYRYWLQESPTLYNVKISLDEPKEARVNRAILHKG